LNVHAFDYLENIELNHKETSSSNPLDSEDENESGNSEK